MKMSILRKLSVAAIAFAAVAAPTAALADDYGIYFFNDGNGTCGYISCTPYGCGVIDTFPCERDVGGG